jgi:hypothetical protein
MAIAAGVVGGALEAAVGIIASFEMATQSGGATQRHGAQHGFLQQRQGGAIGFQESSTEAAHDLCQFENRFGHKAPPGQERGGVGSESRGLRVEASAAVVT